MVVDICMLYTITIHLHYCVRSSLKILVFMSVVCHYTVVVVDLRDIQWYVQTVIHTDPQQQYIHDCA
jgi:hypothetical protein